MTMPIIVVSHTKIGRKSMPQIGDTTKFLTWLHSKGVHYRSDYLYSRHLHPTQFNIDLGKVFRLIDVGLSTVKFPIIISSNKHILDGHHRWYASDVLRQSATCIVVDRQHHTLVSLAKEWEGATYEDIDVPLKVS